MSVRYAASAAGTTAQGNDFILKPGKLIFAPGQTSKTIPLTILDDHSRFLLALHPCTDLTMNTAWTVLWKAFGLVGEAVRIEEADGCVAVFYTTKQIRRIPLDCLQQTAIV